MTTGEPGCRRFGGRRSVRSGREKVSRSRPPKPNSESRSFNPARAAPSRVAVSDWAAMRAASCSATASRSSNFDRWAKWSAPPKSAGPARRTRTGLSENGDPSRAATNAAALPSGTSTVAARPMRVILPMCFESILPPLHTNARTAPAEHLKGTGSIWRRAMEINRREAVLLEFRLQAVLEQSPAGGRRTESSRVRLRG